MKDISHQNKINVRYRVEILKAQTHEFNLHHFFKNRFMNKLLYHAQNVTRNPNL